MSDAPQGPDWFKATDGKWYAPPTNQPRPTNPPTRSRVWPLALGVSLGALIVGGGAGFLAGQLTASDDEAIVASAETTVPIEADASAVETTTVESTTVESTTVDSTAVEPVSAPPGTRIVGQHSGGFQVAVPADWSVRSGADAGAFISARPEAGARKFDAGYLTVRVSATSTAEAALDAVGPESDCPTFVGREPSEFGGYQGVSDVYSDCPNGFQARQFAAAVPGAEVTVIFSVSLRDPEDEARFETLLTSFALGVEGAAVLSPCDGISPSTDPNFPVRAWVVNDTDAPVIITEPADPSVAPFELVVGGVSSGVVSEGTVYAIQSVGGTFEYTFTGAPTHCVLVTPTGVVPGPV